MLARIGGGVVDGLLFDSFEIEPRVRFGPRFGSAAIILLVNFLSKSLSSFGVCGRVLVLVLCGVDAFAVFQQTNKQKNEFCLNLF